ncbi:UNVERIFIED_CONTAM: hypothetical protein FKN15_033791 [Acipenser sinensis]
MRVNTGDKMVELKEDRNLFARMLLVSKSRPEINLEETVERHELSVVPRSMFAAYGAMLHSQVKSSLMAILEKLPKGEDTVPDTNGHAEGQGRNSNDTEDMADFSGGKPAKVKGFLRSFHNMKDVGIVQVKVIRAEGLMAADVTERGDDIRFRNCVNGKSVHNKCKTRLSKQALEARHQLTKVIDVSITMV